MSSTTNRAQEPTLRLTSEQKRLCSLLYGNTAKIYDLALVARTAAALNRRTRVLDLGCGDAGMIATFLRVFQQVDYTGVEPSSSAAARARKNLDGTTATVLNENAYDLPSQFEDQFDFVLSFSTLEHVYQRPRYLAAAARCLTPSGSLLMNYDHGHFIVPALRDRAKALAGPLMARWGDESKFQRQVDETAVVSELRNAGMHITERKFFNVRSLKELSGHVPPDARSGFQTAWLEAELTLNKALPYADPLAPQLLTVNVVAERIVPPALENSSR